MKYVNFFLCIILALFLASCGTDTISESDEDRNLLDSSISFDGSGIAGGGAGGSGSSGSSSGESTSESDPGGQQGGESGLITAGEWNDLENWDYWKELNEREEFSDKAAYWEFYTNNRISVELRYNGSPVVDAALALERNGFTHWETRTDNAGKAELWIGLYEYTDNVDLSQYSLSVNGIETDANLTFFEQGVNVINIDQTINRTDVVELAFIVDATGSMSDELEFLKSDLTDVIQKVEDENSNLEISTASVFYRDQGDEYLVRQSDFTSSLTATQLFIETQVAGGGGDFPEAVHTGLETAISNLAWSEFAKTRIAFLLLDAPPHHQANVIGNLQGSIAEAAKKGIKVIPITASGIDKQTEFLMRFFSISTNSTYTFITNHSGIGNDHIEPSIGEFDVEFLNELMVRLIKEYSE